MMLAILELPPSDVDETDETVHLVHNNLTRLSHEAVVLNPELQGMQQPLAYR